MRRITFLDELLRIPVLRAQEMSTDQLATVAAHRPPLARRSMLRCLSLEHSLPVTATPFHLYSDPIKTYQQQIMDQLIKETLLTWRKRTDKCPQNWRELAQFVTKFVEKEQAAMTKEMEEGDVTRWSGREFLYGEWLDKLSPEQLKMTEGAFQELSNTPQIHPLIKQEILHHICSVIGKVKD